MTNRLELIPKGVDEIIAKYVHTPKYDLQLIHKTGVLQMIGYIEFPRGCKIKIEPNVGLYSSGNFIRIMRCYIYVCLIILIKHMNIRDFLGLLIIFKF